MVRADAISILRILKANYPSTYRGISEQDAEDIINLWTTMFENETLKEVTEAVKALIFTNKFPPTIADVKEKLIIIMEKPAMTELEAWNVVFNAIKDSNYNSVKHFDNFPDVIKKVIRTPAQLREWAQMDSDTVSSVIASNFQRSYKAIAQHTQQVDRLPQSGKTLMEMIDKKLLLEG